jgi:hypothetical protein
MPLAPKISTRQFLAMRIGVSFVTIGSLEPRPSMLMR